MTLTRLHFSASHPKFPGKKPLLFTSFADKGIAACDGEGKPGTVTGLFSALSFDEGNTWPVTFRRVISNLKGSGTCEFEAAAWQRKHTLSKVSGQESGYMSVTQTPDGMIYLSDGKMLYNFNLAWLMAGEQTR
jgi:hypothetical protein